MPCLAGHIQRPRLSPSRAGGNRLETPQTGFHQRQPGRRRKRPIRKGLREIRGWRAEEAAGRGQSEWGLSWGGEWKPLSPFLCPCVGCVSKGSAANLGSPGVSPVPEAPPQTPLGSLLPLQTTPGPSCAGIRTDLSLTHFSQPAVTMAALHQPVGATALCLGACLPPRGQ